MRRNIQNIASMICAISFLACAQDVGDIDRTQSNLLPKAAFVDGKWFVRQTVTEVPATSAFSFVGETGEMEIICWEVQRQHLVGYRAYEHIPGAGQGKPIVTTAGQEELDESDEITTSGCRDHKGNQSSCTRLSMWIFNETSIHEPANKPMSSKKTTRDCGLSANGCAWIGLRRRSVTGSSYPPQTVKIAVSKASR